MPKYIAAVDQGTTSTRCILFDHQGSVVSLSQKEHQQIYPQPGWVEHDPLEIWQRSQEVISAAVAAAGARAGDIAAVGITNQRETTLVWDRNTGKPFYNCDRLAGYTHQGNLRSAVANPEARTASATRSGCRSATYFSAPKIRWILENVPAARQAAESGAALFGNIDTWLIWMAHRRSSGWRSRHRCHQRQPHHADGSGRLCSGMQKFWRSWRSLPRCCRASFLPAIPWYGEPPARMDLLQTVSRYAAIWATSKLPWSGRPASVLAKQKTPTAPAVSCC